MSQEYTKDKRYYRSRYGHLIKPPPVPSILLQLPREIWAIIFGMMDRVTLKETLMFVCKDWMYMARNELELSRFLIVKIEKGIQDLNQVLESYPMLKKIQFRIPQDDCINSKEFIKALNFENCCRLKKVTAQGDFSNSFGFRNKYQQEKYKVDIGFPVEVLEITFNPKVKDHLDTSNIKKMRLHFSAHLMDIALMSHLGGDIPLGMKRLKDCCPYLRVLDVKFGGSKQELINPNLVHTCLTYFNRLDKICFSRGSLNIAVPLCSQPYPFNTIKKLEFDTMKFDKEHLQEIVQIFPVLQELIISSATFELNLGTGRQNDGFDLCDLMEHLEILCHIKTLSCFKVKNVYSTRFEITETVDEQLNNCLRIVRNKFGHVSSIKIPVESHGTYTFAEIAKDKGYSPCIKRNPNNNNLNRGQRPISGVQDSIGKVMGIVKPTFEGPSTAAVTTTYNTFRALVVN